jgi:hypothetical protein
MQIAQFVLGGSFAMAHSFVSFPVPVFMNATEKATPSEGVASESGGSGAMLDTVKNLVFTPCITTTGQNVAVWLNVVYLAPLTYLFMKFFVESYIQRAAQQTERDRQYSEVAATAERAGWDAARGVEREVYGASNEEAVVDDDAKASNEEACRRRRQS